MFPSDSSDAVGVISYPALCTEELLGGRNLCTIAGEVERTTQNTDPMAAVLLSSLDNLLPDPTHILKVSEQKSWCGKTAASVIIGYMHRKDGAKS